MQRLLTHKGLVESQTPSHCTMTPQASTSPQAIPAQASKSLVAQLHLFGKPLHTSSAEQGSLAIRELAQHDQSQGPLELARAQHLFVQTARHARVVVDAVRHQLG